MSARPPDREGAGSAVAQAVEEQIRGRTRLLRLFALLAVIPVVAIALTLASPGPEARLAEQIQAATEQSAAAAAAGTAASEQARRAEDLAQQARQEAEARSDTQGRRLEGQLEALAADVSALADRQEEVRQEAVQGKRGLETMFVTRFDSLSGQLSEREERLEARVLALERQVARLVAGSQPARARYRSLTLAERKRAPIEDFGIELEVGSHRDGVIDRVRVFGGEPPRAVVDRELVVGQPIEFDTDRGCFRITAANVLARPLWARDYVQLDVVKTPCP